MTDHEKAELLLCDFATRAQQDEDRAYRKYRKFLTASERIELSHQEYNVLEDRRRVQ